MLGLNEEILNDPKIIEPNAKFKSMIIDERILQSFKKNQFQIILHLLGYFAEKERKKIKIRQKEAYDNLEKDSKGRKISRKKNKVVGRPNKIEKILQDNNEIIKLWIEKKITTKKILEILNISRSSLFRMKSVIKN